MARPKSPARPKRPPPSKAERPRFDGDESALVVMARVSAPFGVKGWAKLRTFTGERDSLAGHPRWWLRTPEGWTGYALEDFAVHSAATVAKFAGVDDRDAAEAIRGFDVAVARSELEPAQSGTIYWADLVGLDVVNLRGESLGRVEELFETGPTSVLVVRGERERMIPFVDAYVKAVDREAGRITVDWEAEFDT